MASTPESNEARNHLPRVPPVAGGDELPLTTALRDLVPAAFVDGVLDPVALLNALGVEDRPEPFSFTWPGLGDARQVARAATSATLIEDREASVNWEDAEDVLVLGDNLQVLKLLQRGYANSTKLIYIDPPYNTGETFVYSDDYSVPEPQYLAMTGQLDEQGSATTTRLERGGRKHSPWLTMMFPRLAAARHLLRRDGVIIAAIDNNEVHHLRLLLDGLFGANNFIDQITWQGGRKGDAKLTAGGQDYMLVYARDREHLRKLDVRWRERKAGLEEVYAKVQRLLGEHAEDYASATKALRSWYAALPEGNPAKQHSHYNQIDAEGAWTSDNSSSPNYRENLIYEWKGFQPPENGWRYDKAAMADLDERGRLLYPTGNAQRIRIKKYLHEQEYWAPASVFYKDRSAASSTLNALMAGEVFENPKDTDVLARYVEAVTEEGDLVVDFFAGSGSTGHAVWLQNSRDQKRRRWILVQAPEATDEASEARTQGFEAISEITCERLRRASADDAQGTRGFRVFRAAGSMLNIGQPLVATDGLEGADYVEMSLTLSEDEPVVLGAEPLNVAWETVLKATSLPLDARMAVHEVGDVTVFEFVDRRDASSRVFVSLDAFSTEVADAIQLRDTDTLILRSDRVGDSTTLTLAPRLKGKLILLERMAREVSV